MKTFFMALFGDDGDVDEDEVEIDDFCDYEEEVEVHDESDGKISGDSKNPPARSESNNIAESLLRVGEFHLDSEDGSPGINVEIGDRITALSRFQAAARGARLYKKGEIDTVRKVLDEIDLISIKRSKEGLNDFNFSVGVYNCVSSLVVNCTPLPRDSMMNERLRTRLPYYVSNILIPSL